MGKDSKQAFEYSLKRKYMKIKIVIITLSLILVAQLILNIFLIKENQKLTHLLKDEKPNIDNTITKNEEKCFNNCFVRLFPERTSYKLGDTIRLNAILQYINSDSDKGSNAYIVLGTGLSEDSKTLSGIFDTIRMDKYDGGMIELKANYLGNLSIYGIGYIPGMEDGRPFAYKTSISK